MKRNRDSMLIQFMYRYMINLVIIVIGISSVIIVSATFYLWSNIKSEVSAIEDNFIQKASEKQPNWQEVIDGSLYDRYSSYVIEVSDKEKVIAQSSNWNYTFKDGKENLYHMINSFYWMEDRGLMYVETIQVHGMDVRIIVKLRDILHFIKIICSVVGVTLLVGLGGGTYSIYRLTKKNMDPLFGFIAEIEELEQMKEQKKRRLHIPDKPRELAQLAKVFNALMVKIEEQIEREQLFVSNASHELRTPLAAIRGHVKLVKRRGKEHPEIIDTSLQAMDDETKRMEKLMTQLLTLARCDHLEMDAEGINVKGIIHGVVDAYWGEESNIKVVLHLENDVLVLGNRSALEQVLISLIENARKYTNAGGKITIELKKREQFMELVVSDTGIGIEEHELARIFDRFYRVDKDRGRQTGGTGLGLAIASQLIALHDGTIHVQSTFGEGSSFTVILPNVKKGE